MKVASVTIEYEDGRKEILKGKKAKTFVDLFLATPTEPKKINKISVVWRNLVESDIELKTK